ncbi:MULTISPECIES: hemolysin family protein [Alcaligenaceae]|nr:hemolysin family protein [Bordetella genomosp. 10]
MFFYIGLFVLLLAVTAFFNVAELALVASRPERLQTQSAAHGAAARVQALKEEPGAFLATTQSGVTMASILAGTFCVVAFEHAFAQAAAMLGADAANGYVQPLASLLAVVLTTYLTLVLGELLPKRLALSAPERCALLALPLVRLSMGVFRPFIWALLWSTDGVLRVLGVRDWRGPQTTEEEIRYVIASGVQSGVLRHAEHDMMESILQLGSRSVRTIMTSRQELEWVDQEMPREEAIERIAHSPCSKLVVTSGRDLDHPVGVVAKKDFLRQYLAEQSMALAPLLTPPVFVPDTATVMTVLNKLKHARAQMLFVVDEFGTLMGIVTLTDVLEALAGDVPELERDERGAQDVKRQSDGSYLVPGTMPADDLAEFLSLRDAEAPGYKTVAGLILSKLRRLPQAGEHVTVDGWRLEIVRVDGRTIQAVRLVPPAGAPAAAAAGSPAGTRR